MWLVIKTCNNHKKKSFEANLLVAAFLRVFVPQFADLAAVVFVFADPSCGGAAHLLTAPDFF